MSRALLDSPVVPYEGVRRPIESRGRGGAGTPNRRAWFDTDTDTDTDTDGCIKGRRIDGGGNGLRCHLSAPPRLRVSPPFQAARNPGRVA